LGGVGLGLGAKDYQQVLIFKSKETLNKFVKSGWEFGGHADAVAKAGRFCLNIVPASLC
jgi:lipid-binding SYLF domain-containing protein